MTSYNKLIMENLSDSAQVLLHFGYKEVDSISRIAEEIVRIYQHGGKILFCGNGGSAAQAEHLAAEFVGRFKLNRPSLPALALTTNSALTTAIANDFGYESIFHRQILGLASPGDIVIFLSTSGRSSNIVQAAQTAKTKKIMTMGWTGTNGTELINAVDISLVVPSNDTPRIQEAHLVAGHIICSLVELTLFGGNNV